MKSFTNHIVRF